MLYASNEIKIDRKEIDLDQATAQAVTMVEADLAAKLISGYDLWFKKLKVSNYLGEQTITYIFGIEPYNLKKELL